MGEHFYGASEIKDVGASVKQDCYPVDFLCVWWVAVMMDIARRCDGGWEWDHVCI